MHTRTKIICTIGPSTNSYKAIKELALAGMNVVRINMSHADHDSAKKIISYVTKFNDNNSSKVAVLLDTQGPEIRTGDRELPMDLKLGDMVSLTVRDEIDVETSSIKINYKDLIKSVKKGSRISVDNGLINFEVISKEHETLKCKVLDGGKLGSKRHVNLPGVRINLPSITAKDIDDIQFGITQKVDFIALSFVRNAKDVAELNKILIDHKSSAKIISKIENYDGLNNIDEICMSSWGVMVARGDLGIETSLTNLPNIQRKIMHSCAKHGKRSIVATHLLESMIKNPTPTRAEVTDIANAIYEGTDAVMLSGETSIGKYPVECIKFIKTIAQETEKFKTLGYEKNLILNSDWKHIGQTAKNLAESINANGIIAITRTGATASFIASAKPNGVPIFTFTNNEITHRQLNLVGSTIGFFLADISNHDETILECKKILKKKFNANEKLKFIIVSGIFSEKHSDAIQIINF